MATLPESAAQPRIVTLDIIRGVAVMGILTMNIVGFAMPYQAYANPLAYGGAQAIDLASYTVNFILFDGKMRGLFALLFGASLLLIAERAERGGKNSLSLVVRRQSWLLVFGMIHFYLIWPGDILIALATMGTIAWLVRGKGAIELTALGIALLLVDLFITGEIAYSATLLRDAATGPNPDSAAIENWAALNQIYGIPSPDMIASILDLYRGPWIGFVAEQTGARLIYPFRALLDNGWETLGYMLLGMAGLKSGYLTGEWDRALYRKIAITALAIGVPGYAILAALLFQDGFTATGVLTYVLAASAPFRAVMVIGYAALIVLLIRPDGRLAGRVAAAGRAAFTNYLGTSLVMTGIFYGWGIGLFGTVGRAELWLFVLPAWAVMLLWSKPWLDRFDYGPLEWLWRSLVRGRPQSMLKASPDGAA